MKKKWLLLILLTTACHIGSLLSPPEEIELPQGRLRFCNVVIDTVPVVLYHIDTTAFIFQDCF